MDYGDLIKNRYSCKKYSDKKVDEALIKEILEAGRLAPTAKNQQPARVYVLQSDEMLKKVDELTPCRYNAPVVLLVAYDKNNIYNYPGGKHDSGVEDATIVATHLMLAATNAGVDNCWLNFFDPEKAKIAFKLPENEEVVMLLDLGYKAPGIGPLANHMSRKDLNETVKFL